MRGFAREWNLWTTYRLRLIIIGPCEHAAVETVGLIIDTQLIASGHAYLGRIGVGHQRTGRVIDAARVEWRTIVSLPSQAHTWLIKENEVSKSEVSEKSLER